MKKLAKVISYSVLGLMIIFSCLVFVGTISVEANKLYMLILTILWFVSAPLWMLDVDKR